MIKTHREAYKYQEKSQIHLSQSNFFLITWEIILAYFYEQCIKYQAIVKLSSMVSIYIGYLGKSINQTKQYQILLAKEQNSNYFESNHLVSFASSFDHKQSVSPFGCKDLYINLGQLIYTWTQ